jgi:hypothetical protein
VAAAGRRHRRARRPLLRAVVTGRRLRTPCRSVERDAACACQRPSDVLGAQAHRVDAGARTGSCGLDLGGHASRTASVIRTRPR